MFKKVLIANRGEIAIRVIRACRDLGLATVAVYSDADRAALHVRLADEAVRLGPAPSSESYLNVAALVDAARRTGADAVHPGYGFLSENAAFAEACAEAGVTFVGPPPAAIRAMGGKSEAKALMAEAGVPLVPGYHGADQDPAVLAREAERIGYPVLVKASAGGGGKGMRLVTRPEDLAAAVADAAREAAAAFGDPAVFLERYVSPGRHVEVQVLGDHHGTVVHPFDMRTRPIIETILTLRPLAGNNRPEREPVNPQILTNAPPRILSAPITVPKPPPVKVTNLKTAAKQGMIAIASMYPHAPRRYPAVARPGFFDCAGQQNAA